MTQSSPPLLKERKSPHKFSPSPLSSKISRWFRAKFPNPDDYCTHGSQSTCSQCKYSPFDGDKYCPKLYRNCITSGEVENSRKSIFHRLPPAIISLVIEHLKPFEVECLRYVCRLFYHNYPSTRFLTAQGRFELQCLMERDPGSKQWLAGARNIGVLTTTLLVAIYHTAKIPSSADVTRACQALDILLCPHVHLGDSWVIQQYKPDLVALHMYRLNPTDGCCCLLCKGFMCRFCDSRFKFSVHARKEPVASTCIGLLIMRNIGKLHDPDDPVWLKQLSITKLPDYRTQWSDRIVAMYLNCVTGVPEDSPESRTVSRLLEYKAKCALYERDRWTTSRLGNSRVEIKTLHKPLWRPPLRRRDRNYWRWVGYESDGFIAHKKFLGESGPRKPLHLQ